MKLLEHGIYVPRTPKNPAPLFGTAKGFTSVPSGQRQYPKCLSLPMSAVTIRKFLLTNERFLF